MLRVFKSHLLRQILKPDIKNGRIKTMRVFISQPMRDKTDEQIKSIREAVIKYVSDKYEDDVEAIDSFFEGAPHDAKPLWFLGKSFELLSTADLAVFVDNWNEYRGCVMENDACEKYGIEFITVNSEAI